MIDLIALAAVDRETEVTYIRREPDWAERAAAAGRIVRSDRLLPVLPASLAGGNGGNGHGGRGPDNGHDHGNGHGAHGAGAGSHAGHG